MVGGVDGQMVDRLDSWTVWGVHILCKWLAGWVGGWLVDWVSSWWTLWVDDWWTVWLAGGLCG